MEIQRVLISDSCDPRCAAILKEAGCEVTVKTDHTPEQLIENIKNFDALVVRSATKVTAAVINAAPNLKVRLPWVSDWSIFFLETKLAFHSIRNHMPFDGQVRYHL